MQLTKETDKFLCEIYQEYLRRRKSGIPKSQAIHFSEPEKIVEEFMQGTLPQDMHDCINELKKVGYVHSYVTNSFYLESPAIVYMENRFTNGLKEVTDFIAKFIP